MLRIGGRSGWGSAQASPRSPSFISIYIVSIQGRAISDRLIPVRTVWPDSGRTAIFQIGFGDEASETAAHGITSVLARHQGHPSYGKPVRRRETAKEACAAKADKSDKLRPCATGVSLGQQWQTGREATDRPTFSIRNNYSVSATRFRRWVDGSTISSPRRAVSSARSVTERGGYPGSHRLAAGRLPGGDRRA